MIVSLIAAIGPSGVIGNHNTLPWHIPEELNYFKKITMGKPIIMGRKTFESLNNKPLPHRMNIIISTGLKNAPGCHIAANSAQALEKAKEHAEVMVIGGAKIYEMFLPLASRMYLSFIHMPHKGDVFFPTINWNEWQATFEQKHELFTTKIFYRKK